MSPELDAVFAAALSRQPELRPATCGQLIELIMAAADLELRAPRVRNAIVPGSVASTPAGASRPETVSVVQVLHLCASPEQASARERESLGITGLELTSVSTVVDARAFLRVTPVQAFVCDLGEATDVALPFIEALRSLGTPCLVYVDQPSPKLEQALGASLVPPSVPLHDALSQAPPRLNSLLPKA